MSKIVWGVIGVVVVGAVGVLSYAFGVRQEQKVITTNSDAIQNFEEKPFILSEKRQSFPDGDMYKGYVVVEG